MQVNDIMNRELITVGPDDSVEEAVKLLHRRGIRHLLVVRQGKLVGIVSDRDLKRALDPLTTKKKIIGVGGLYFMLEPLLVREIMTATPVTIPPTADIRQAAWIMVERKFGALPVVQAGKLLGIVTETDLLCYFAETCCDDEPPAATGGATKKAPAAATGKTAAARRGGRGK